VTKWVKENSPDKKGPCLDLITILKLLEPETRPRRTIEDKIRKVMFYIADRDRWVPGSYSFNTRNRNKICSSASLQHLHELVQILSYCKEKGYLRYDEQLIERLRDDSPQKSRATLTLTVDGMVYAEDANRKETLSNQCFVAMWFDKSVDHIYEQAIKPAIEDAGYTAYRVDRDPHNNKIDDQIIAQIRQSRFVLADFTSEKGKHRGGVYFEAGFAQGLGLDVIWTCQEDLLNDIHFDTRQYKHIGWSEDDPDALKERIYDSIGANIGYNKKEKA
jgi:nucleoside 2-deoxyribosyltransferase